VSTPLITFKGGSGVPVDLTRLVASRLLIQANSGGGKSRAMRYLLEQTHGRVQQIVLDPEGEYSSLREKFPYVLAGREGDVATDPKTAKLLCRRLMELGASAVIDLYDLSLPERRRYVRLFLEELMHLPRELWRPLLVGLDESHVFAPEAGQAESLEAVTITATQGRKRGYCLCAATQRLSKLHKDVAAELLNKLIGRTGLDVDVKRAGDELGFDKERRGTLPRLEPGEFYAYGPAIANTVTLVRTGEVQTRHPEPGEVGAVAPPAPAAVKKMLERLADLPGQAAEEAKTIEEAQRRIRELERELRGTKKGQPAVDPQAVERAVAAAVAKADVAWQRERKILGKSLAPFEDMAWKIANGLAGMTGELKSGAAAAVAAAPPVPSTNGHRPSVGLTPEIERALAAERGNIDGFVPSGPQQRMLDALASFEAIGVEHVARSHVAVYSNQSSKSSGFDKNMSTLSSAGLIERVQGGFVRLSQTGRQLARADSAPASLDALHDAWYAKLSGPQRLMLQLLVVAYPEPVSREDLASGSGQSMKSSGFDKNESTLSSLGLMERMPDRNRRAGAILFPDGLR
jgi:hypothetical protein